MQNWKPILILLGMAAFVNAALKTADAQGGKITYGTVDGQTTESGAMGALFKSLHTQYGDRPQVGKLFQVRGTQSVAAFFAIANRHLAGMVIVTKVGENRVEAGMISGDAAHFGSNYNPMMKTLMTAWHPFEGASATSTGAAPQARAQGGAAVHTYTTPDQTASVDLPDGWKPQQGSNGGTILAQGPNGESATLGSGFLAYDLNNPNVQQTYQKVQNGGLRNTAYSNGIYYALNSDMARMRVDLVQAFRRKNGLPPATVRIASAVPVQSPPRQRCAYVTGTGTSQEGKSTEFMEIFCVSAPTPAGGIFMVTVTGTYVPAELAAKERPTMGAILQSFSMDMRLVQQQAAQYAAPAIDAIHAIGRAAAAQAAAAHASNDAWNSSVYKRWDNLDKRSKEFSNYQLGYSVIRDVDNNYHGTFWNEDAALLVQSNPDRFEYVNAPDFWKGVDY
jgi:hypothetical protein